MVMTMNTVDPDDKPMTDDQIDAWLDFIIGADPVPATNLPGSPDPTPKKDPE
jgi:hypothetical protein